MRRRFRQPTTRDRILDDLRRSVVDTIRQHQAPAPKVCSCLDCRLARAVDISPNPRVLLVTEKDYRRIVDLSEALNWSQQQLTAFTMSMFQKAPALLREVEAGAIIAHLERQDF